MLLVKVVFFLIAISLLSPVFVIAQEDKKEEQVPAGMEKKRIGKADFIVPKDMKVSKQADLLVLEPLGDYVARKIADMQERLKKMEEAQKELKDKIEELNKALDEMKNE